MALSIKTEEADALARALAAATQESLTEAVTIALRERLARVQRRPGDIAARLERLSADYSSRPGRDTRTVDEILGYDENGVPT